MPGILPPKVLFATLSSLKHFRVGDSVIVTDKNNAIYTKQADGTWRADFSDPVSTTLANLGSAAEFEYGTKRIVTNCGFTSDVDVVMVTCEPDGTANGKRWVGHVVSSFDFTNVLGIPSDMTLLWERR